MTPLNEDQVRLLLASAMAYDNRRPGDANVEAWMEAAARGRWTFVAAWDAIDAHYAESAVFLMPAHITARLRVERRQPAPVKELEPPSGPPAEPEWIRDLVAAVAARLGWQRTETTRSDPELQHPCPHPPCQAGRGRPCGRRVTRGAHRGEWAALRDYHASRTELANDKTHGSEKR
jgi:hypothetical protein